MGALPLHGRAGAKQVNPVVATAAITALDDVSPNFTERPLLEVEASILPTKRLLAKRITWDLVFYNG